MSTSASSSFHPRLIIIPRSTQLLLQKRDDRAEWLGAPDLEDALFQGGRGADGLEPDCYFGVGDGAGGGEGERVRGGGCLEGGCGRGGGIVKDGQGELGRGRDVGDGVVAVVGGG